MDMTEIENVYRFKVKAALIIGAAVGVFFGLIIGLMVGSANQGPEYCYYERGTITHEHGGNYAYYIHFVNDAGRERKISLHDGKMAESQATRLTLRWCWIPSIEAFRIRGAWRE